MSEKVSELVLRLKRETGQITTNPLLDGIDLTTLVSFEQKAESDANFVKNCKRFYLVYAMLIFYIVRNITAPLMPIMNW